MPERGHSHIPAYTFEPNLLLRIQTYRLCHPQHEALYLCSLTHILFNLTSSIKCVTPKSIDIPFFAVTLNNGKTFRKRRRIIVNKRNNYLVMLIDKTKLSILFYRD